MIAILVLCIVATLAIGFISIRRQALKQVSLHSFAVEYRKEFENVLLSRGTGTIDREKLGWLIKHSDKMQSQLGIIGIMDYKPAYQTYVIRGYHIIINTVIRLDDQDLQLDEVRSVDNALLRQIGSIENENEVTRSNLTNPFKWFSEGIRNIVSIPFYMLSWFGILGTSTVSKIISTAFFKVVAGIIAFIGLVSSIVTIIQGKDQTMQFVKQYLTTDQDTTAEKHSTKSLVKKTNKLKSEKPKSEINSSIQHKHSQNK